MNIRDKIYEYLDDTNNKMGTMDELLKAFEIPSDQRNEFKRIINKMEDEGYLFRTNKDRLGTARRLGLIEGRVQGNPKGFAFLIPDESTQEEQEDVFIRPGGLKGALHGDRVAVRIVQDEPDYIADENERRTGEVVKILTRANNKLIGTYQKSQKFGFVVPLENKISSDVFVLLQDSMDAKTGQLVEVQITKWGDGEKSPEGKILDVLGFEDEKGVDVLAIIKKYGLPYVFPDEVIKEANAISEDIRPEEIARREDLRDEVTFTIDGADARDFDDAVSIKKMDNGNYELGVHIADVSFYVREGTALDEEALDRGTSVYFPDRVIPMLPEKLSNGVCSLMPDVDRLAMSVFMEIDKYGKVVNHRIYESVIKSSARLIYDDVSDFLENDAPEAKKKFEELGIADDLKYMQHLAEILNEKRIKRGSIGFDFPESQINVDENGKPIEIKELERRVGNRLIEEFMIVTNETVAENIFWTETPFLYRIHEEPDEEKIESFKKFLNTMGYKLRSGADGIEPRHLQELLNDIKGKKEEPIISRIMLRSLKKAKYSVVEEGHFGLASEYYSHFTSPIRRYPDLQIHRILREFLNSRLDSEQLKHYERLLPSVAQSTSLAERRADDAERESDDLKKAEYMADRIGQEFVGVVSSVISSGLFVELENTIEGFIPIHSIDYDYYHYNDEMHQLVGENTRKIIKLGDRMRIKVVSAVPSTRKIDFALLENLSERRTDEENHHEIE